MNIHDIYTPNQVSKVLGNLSRITLPFWTVWFGCAKQTKNLERYLLIIYWLLGWHVLALFWPPRIRNLNVDIFLPWMWTKLQPIVNACAACVHPSTHFIFALGSSFSQLCWTLALHGDKFLTKDFHFNEQTTSIK